MQNTEKLCLKWSDFQENLNLALGGFRNDNDFADVTLASEDGTQIEAHKMVLALSSPFFKEMLKKNKHPHPLIFMRGVRAEELSAIVDFLYFGEANVNQESLDVFLSLAEELKLKGLTNSSGSNHQEYGAKPHSTENNFEPKKPKFESTSNEGGSLVEYNRRTETKSGHAMIVNVEAQKLDEQVKSMMTTTETKMTYGNQSRKIFACNVCGKEGNDTNIKTHIEANHIVSDITHTCDICGKTSRSRDGLRQHKAKEHSKSPPLQD